MMQMFCFLHNVIRQSIDWTLVLYSFNTSLTLTSDTLLLYIPVNDLDMLHYISSLNYTLKMSVSICLEKFHEFICKHFLKLKTTPTVKRSR